MTNALASGHRWAIDSPDRRRALLNACIEVMRDRHRRSPATFDGAPSSPVRALALVGIGEAPGRTPPEPRIRRVVTLLPASRIPDAGLR